MSPSFLDVDLGAPVARIAIDRPERLNALTPEICRALVAAIERAAATEGVRALVLGSGDRGFCSGADIRDALSGLSDLPEDEVRRAIGDTFHGVVRALMACPLPTVAAVRGAAVGIGLSFALACDLRVVAHDAQLGAVFARIGLVPDGGSTFLLPRMVGLPRALELMLRAPVFDGRRALELGLATESLPADEVEARARALAEDLASGAAGVYARIRKMVYAHASADLDTALRGEAATQAERLGSDEAREGIAAYLERRPPRFPGAPGSAPT